MPEKQSGHHVTTTGTPPTNVIHRFVMAEDVQRVCLALPVHGQTQYKLRVPELRRHRLRRNELRVKDGRDCVPHHRGLHPCDELLPSNPTGLGQGKGRGSGHKRGCWPRRPRSAQGYSTWEQMSRPTRSGLASPRARRLEPGCRIRRRASPPPASSPARGVRCLCASAFGYTSPKVSCTKWYGQHIPQSLRTL